jgi:hypothetical protein
VQACWTFSAPHIESDTYTLWTPLLPDYDPDSWGLSLLYRVGTKTVVAPTLGLLLVLLAAKVIEWTPVVMLARRLPTPCLRACQASEKVAPASELQGLGTVQSNRYTSAVLHISHYGLESYELSRHADYEAGFAGHASWMAPAGWRHGVQHTHVTPSPWTWRHESLSARLREVMSDTDFVKSPDQMAWAANRAAREALAKSTTSMPIVIAIVIQLS